MFLAFLQLDVHIHRILVGEINCFLLPLGFDFIVKKNKKKISTRPDLNREPTDFDDTITVCRATVAPRVVFLNSFSLNFLEGCHLTFI